MHCSPQGDADCSFITAILEHPEPVCLVREPLPCQASQSGWSLLKVIAQTQQYAPAPVRAIFVWMEPIGILIHKKIFQHAFQGQGFGEQMIGA